ncbi:MAG TPA: hypothetical protein VKV28_17390 [Candidatus Binataceae bacterium]|nr:hypothetical protein [Candidatus Binataceae bacterium]
MKPVLVSGLFILILWSATAAAPPVQSSPAGYYYCVFDRGTADGGNGSTLRIWLGEHGVVQEASGFLRNRDHFCRYLTSSPGQYVVDAGNIQAMVVLNGARGLFCPQSLREAQVMVSIRPGLGQSTMESPAGNSVGQCSWLPANH